MRPRHVVCELVGTDKCINRYIQDTVRTGGALNGLHLGEIKCLRPFGGLSVLCRFSSTKQPTFKTWKKALGGVFGVELIEEVMVANGRLFSTLENSFPPPTVVLLVSSNETESILKFPLMLVLQMGAVHAMPVLAPILFENVAQAQAQFPLHESIVQAQVVSVEQAQIPVWVQASSIVQALPQAPVGLQDMSMPQPTQIPVTSIVPVVVDKDPRKRDAPVKETQQAKKPKVVKASAPTAVPISKARQTEGIPQAKSDPPYKLPGKRVGQQQLAVMILRQFLTSDGFYTVTTAFKTALTDGGYHKAKAKHFSTPLKIATLIRGHLIPPILRLDPAQPLPAGVKELIQWHNPPAGWNGMWNLCPILTLEYSKHNVPHAPASNASAIEIHRR